MPTPQDTTWVGVDIGKTHHWVCAVDATGNALLSRKVANDEAQISAVIAAVNQLAGHRVWAIDILGTPSALLVGLLAAAGQLVRYASGRLVNAMAAAYTGEGKTDAKDAYVIAETARIRTDLSVVDTDTELVATLGVLIGYRADLVADRVRMINRMRDLLTSVFPGLEREFDFASCKGALVLLTGYATPDAIRRMGEARLSRWLRQRRVRGYADVAARARGCRQDPTHRPGWPRRHRQHHRRACRRGTSPARPPQRPGNTDRRGICPASAGASDHLDARVWTGTWCRPARRRRQPGGVSHRRAFGCGRGAGAGPQRFGPPRREPAQTPSL